MKKDQFITKYHYFGFISAGQLQKPHVDNLKTAIEKLNNQTTQHLQVVGKVGEFILENGPLVPTENVIKMYRDLKNLPTETKMKSKSMFEIINRHLPICHVYLNNKAFILENRLKEVIESMQDILKDKLVFETINIHVSDKIGSIYKDALKFMDTKRDRDTLKGILAKVTSIRFAACLEGVESRYSVRNAKNSLSGNIVRWNDIIQTSLTVRSDMTSKQQHCYNQRIATQRKFKEMKVCVILFVIIMYY